MGGWGWMAERNEIKANLVKLGWKLGKAWQQSYHNCENYNKSKYTAVGVCERIGEDATSTA